VKNISTFLLVAGFAVATTLIAEADPKARIQETEIDFGKIEKGESETKKVIIRNVGDSKLEITKLGTNSTSLIPVILDKSIEPNDKGEIEIKFDSTGIKPCRLVKYVYVYTNDPDLKDRSIPVTCSATVVPVNAPLIQLQPYEIDLGVVNPGETVKRSVTYRNVGTADLEVEPIQYIDQNFKITKNITDRILAPGKNGVFEISFERATPGKIDSFIILKSNSAGDPYSKVAFTGEVARKSISITGLEPIKAAEGSTDKPERYGISFGNYYSPYKLKVTVLSGPQKGKTFEVRENTLRSDFLNLDPDKPGKKISVQLDIIIEDAPQKESEPAEKEKPAEKMKPDEVKPPVEKKDPKEKNANESEKPAGESGEN